MGNNPQKMDSISHYIKTEQPGFIFNGSLGPESIVMMDFDDTPLPLILIAGSAKVPLDAGLKFPAGVNEEHG